VIDAEPGASLGIGLIRELSDEELRDAALSGEIEDLLEWRPVERGDCYYIPAGTVHAIGAGVSLIEVQQNADVTYRLYDYGRPRPLHLDEAMAVAHAGPYAEALHRQVAIDGDDSQALVAGPKFHLSLAHGNAQPLPGTGPHFVIPIAGTVQADASTVQAGECLVTDAPEALQPDSDSRYLLARAA